MAKIIFNSELDFIENYNKQLVKTYNKINEVLTKSENMKIKKIKGYDLLKTIQYKDLNNWSVKSENQTLTALSSKIQHMMFNIGCPSSVVPMLNAILKGTKRIKHYQNKRLFKRNLETISNGNGHFRWNYQVYTLNTYELKIVEKLFK